MWARHYKEAAAAGGLLLGCAVVVGGVGRVDLPCCCRCCCWLWLWLWLWLRLRLWLWLRWCWAC